MNIKLSDSYFKKLLYETEPIEALQSLNQFWCRPALDKNSPLFGLAEPEFNVHIIRWYLSEVGNGGHMQFFMNNIAEYSVELASAIEKVGITDLFEIFKRACSIFPNGVVMKDWYERDAFLQVLDDASQEFWSNLDRQVGKLNRQCDEALIQYLRSNEFAILVPERRASQQPVAGDGDR